MTPVEEFQAILNTPEGIVFNQRHQWLTKYLPSALKDSAKFVEMLLGSR
jgi:hypothetical protein